MAAWFIIVLIGFLVLSTSLCEYKEDILDFAVLVPQESEDGGCTRAALELAADDANQIENFIVRPMTKNVYKIRLRFSEVDESGANALEALYNLYHNNDSKIVYSTIGPPHKDQSEYCTEYSTANANVHVSYQEANEPMEEYFVFWYPTPPSIISSFQTVKSIMNLYNWTKMAIIYDYSDQRYRKNSDNLRAIIQKKTNGTKPIEILADQGIWSDPPSYKVSMELQIIQNQGARIIFGLLSVPGARKVFCEAYKRQMFAPKVIWILFEILPNDWASDKYNTGFDEEKKITQREISCSESELVYASRNYISITKHGLRRDGVRAVSNITAEEFRFRLKEKVKAGTKCHENVAYAYDALWVLALAHKAYAASNDTLDYKKYNYQDFPVALALRDFVRELDFEGLTGRITYEIQLHDIWNRVGRTAIWSNKQNEDPIYVGKHIYRSNELFLVPNSEKLLFQKGIIPRDEALYVTVFLEYSSSIFITMWSIAMFGVILSLGFLFAIFLYPQKGNESFSSSIIYSIMVFGSLLCFAAVIIYGMDTRFVAKENAPKVCWSFLITLSLGFTLTFGSLFSKTWQLYKLYLTPEIKVENNQLHLKNISEWSLLIIIAIFLFIDVLILITWRNISDFEYEVRNITNKENLFQDTIHVEQIIKCTCKYQTPFVIGMYSYKGIMLLFGIFIAWQTRNARIQIQNESKQIAMAIYNVVAVSLIGVTCVSVLTNTTSTQAVYTIIAVCICVCTLTTLLLIFVPKIRKIMYNDDLKMQVDSKSKPRSSTTNNVPIKKLSIGYLRRSMEKKTKKMVPTCSIGTISTQLSTEQQQEQQQQTPTTSSHKICVSLASQSSSETSQTGSLTSVGSNMFVLPAYLTNSTFMSPPSYKDSYGNQNKHIVDDAGKLSCGIYVGRIDKESPNYKIEQLKDTNEIENADFKQNTEDVKEDEKENRSDE